MVSHVDHTEHDVDILVTEQGLADLRAATDEAAEKLAGAAMRSGAAGRKPLKARTIILHGTADQNVPHKATGLRLSKLLPQARYAEYDGAPHGVLATNADEVNRDLLAFLREV